MRPVHQQVSTFWHRHEHCVRLPVTGPDVIERPSETTTTGVITLAATTVTALVYSKAPQTSRARWRTIQWPEKMTSEPGAGKSPTISGS